MSAMVKGDQTGAVEPLVLTMREEAEIRHAMFYAVCCHHGTTGHNQLMLIAKLAQHIGFTLADFDLPIKIPNDVAVVNGFPG